MKENLETFIAAVGCTLLLSVGLFLLGVFLGGQISLDLPAPPRWLFISFGLLPVCATLYLRAYRRQQRAARWLESWQRSPRRRVVGYRSIQTRPDLDEAWLKSQLEQGGLRSWGQRWLNSVTWWGGATLLSLLIVVYVCLSLGLLMS